MNTLTRPERTLTTHYEVQWLADGEWRKSFTAETLDRARIEREFFGAKWHPCRIVCVRTAIEREVIE